MKRTDGTERPSHDVAFLFIAEVLASLSTCPEGARHGAVITIDRRIVATGYGSPAAGIEPCTECWLRKKFKETGIKDFSVCPSIHAEMNAIISAARAGVSVLGGTLYVTKEPCAQCKRALTNAGIVKVIT